jgi:hypothetical protein
MSHQLDGVRAKLQWAYQHLQNINNDIIVGKKVRVHPNAIRVSAETDTSGPVVERRVVFHVRGNPPALDLSFSIQVGETIHQLRSALDHLVYELIILKTKKPPTFHSAFPIVGCGRMNKKGWITAADLYANNVQTLKQNISPTAMTRLDDLQPFKLNAASRDTDALWILSELDNAYKHRLLRLMVHRIVEYRAKLRSGSIERTVNFQPDIRFEDGAEIGRTVIDDPDFSIADKDMSVKSKTVVAIALAEVIQEKNVPVFDCLLRLHTRVWSIVDDFAGEF